MPIPLTIGGAPIKMDGNEWEDLVKQSEMFKMLAEQKAFYRGLPHM